MHDVRLLSVKHFKFRLIYKTRGISGVRIFKFRVRGIPQVLDPLRNGSALMTRTALVHGPAVAWSVSRRDILPEHRKFICTIKL